MPLDKVNAAKRSHFFMENEVLQPGEGDVGTRLDAFIASKYEVSRSRASKIIEEVGLAPWVNIQANGNWGLLPNAELFFHIHIYGRNKTDNWAKPISLPQLPGTFENEPMPEADRLALIEAFKKLS